MNCWKCNKQIPRIDNYDDGDCVFEDYGCEACDLTFEYEFGAGIWGAAVREGAKEDVSDWRSVVNWAVHFDRGAIEQRWCEVMADDEEE